MTCALCPLSLVCLSGFVRVSHCSHCQRVIVAMPPRLAEKGAYTITGDEVKVTSFPKMIVEYMVATCDDLDMLPEVRNRMHDCPACDPDSVHNNLIMHAITGMGDGRLR